MRENFSAHAWKLFRTCVKTFPHLRENFSALTWKLLCTCVKTFMHMRENFTALAWKIFPHRINTKSNRALHWATITIYPNFEFNPFIFTNVIRIYNDNNESLTLNFKFIGPTSKATKLLSGSQWTHLPTLSLIHSFERKLYCY